jgi:selenide,water dikinase
VQQTTSFSQDLVFVGGGHSHALVLRELGMRPLAGLRVTLISPTSHTPYSGMLPGLIAGHYSYEQTHIDLARLCQWAGVRFIAAEVAALDPEARLLSIAGRPPVGYDLLSIDIGSQPDLDSVPGARQHAVPVKPVASLWSRWRDLYSWLEGITSGEPRRLAVVGGGAGGIELAMAMAHTLAGRPVSVQLYWSGPHLLDGYNGRARRSVERALLELGVKLHPNSRVAGVEAGQLRLADGAVTRFDQLFWCTGASAAGWIGESGLQTDERGFLAVRDTLQAVSDERIFGAGDIATQLNHPRPKAGVFAVRQAPVLAANLRNLLLHKPLREHRPQRRFLSLVSLGGRRAVADKGWFSVTGSWVWRWKDRIDREFMGRFEDLPTVMATAGTRLPETSGQAGGQAGQAHCGGCGAKLGADTLGRVLSRLSARYPDHCRREDLGGDTSRVPVTGEQTLVQSIDVLRSLVADPWLMGRIAANHALSDLYASGARPVSALASITLPFATEALLERELEQLLAGALSEFSSVNCRLTGGHSLQGAELSAGFVVNGVPAEPGGRLLAKTGLSPGDRLILTKPLGTGALFAAHMQLRADGRHIADAIAAMLHSNAAAARVAVAHGASACTDITGFGLAGHLLEMLDPAYAAQLQLASLPLLEGARDSIVAGIRSSMHAANATARQQVRVQGAADEATQDLLFDPQTSGGLLIGVPAERADSLVAALHAEGYVRASIIGEVIPRDELQVSLLVT